MVGVLGLAFGPATAGELVKFQTDSIPLTPFKVKRAKAKGIVLAPEPGVELKGHLSRPKVDGRRPAIIVLVSGDGLQSSHLTWGDTLARWGYVALVVDSFGSRDGTDYRDTKGVDITTDAYNAFSYLRGLDFGPTPVQWTVMN